MEDPVVVVELREGGRGRGRVVLDSAAGAAAIVVVVTMKGEMGSTAFMTECTDGFRKRVFFVRMIQSDVGGGLRRPNGREIAFVLL
jgi:hypothetical protein